MTMKTQKMIFASLLGGLILLAGCQKEGGLSGSKDGQFRFGAKSNAGILTRSDYGDYNNDKTHQDIVWKNTDDIRIYSPKASRRIAVEQADAAGNQITPESTYHWADYKIIPDASDPTKATIENVNNDGNYTADQVGTNVNGNPDLGNGLAWRRGEEDIEHTFYAVYPAVKQRGVAADEGMGVANVPGTGGEIALNIPAGNQNFSEKGNLEQYGYMTAYAKGSASATGGNIALNFYPAFTAFEISIRSADAAIGFSSFTLSAASGTAPALTGSYKAKYDASGKRTYDFTAADAATGNRSISVNLNGQSAPAASEDKDLTFTVLALPRDLTDLSVSFTLAGGTATTRTLKLNKNGKPVSFTGGNKHRIYGLVLSNGELLISVETKPWGRGSFHEYTTIEDVSTFFESYQRWNGKTDPKDWSVPNYVGIAAGRSTTERVNPDDPASALTNLPLYSPSITLTTVSTETKLLLRSDNPNIGFVVADENGIYPMEPSQTLEIPISTVTSEYPYGVPVETTFFVVPVNDSAVGQTANVGLFRVDNGAPVAYSHYDMPGSTDHTKVLYKVLSIDDFQNKTHTTISTF